MTDFVPRLKFRLIWQDGDVAELQVSAFSEHFAGQADVYASHDELELFANGIVGFPTGSTDQRSFRFHTSPGGNRVSLEFRTANSLGLSMVDVEIHESESSHESASVRVLTEPSAIDDFAMQLRTLANAQIGEAVLRGCRGVVASRAL